MYNLKTIQKVQPIHVIAGLSGVVLAVLIPNLGKGQIDSEVVVCCVIVGLIAMVSLYGIWRRRQVVWTYASIFVLGLIMLDQLFDLQNPAPLSAIGPYVYTLVVVAASGYGLFGDFRNTNADDLYYPYNRY